MRKIVYILSMCIFMVTLQGCGGGSSTDSGGASLTTTASSTSAIAGGSVSLSSQLSTTKAGFPLNSIDVTYTSNRPDLIHFASNVATNTGGNSISVKTNPSGTSVIIVNIDNSVAIPTGGISVAISASSSGAFSVTTLQISAVAAGGVTTGTNNIAVAMSVASIADNGGQSTATAMVTNSAGTALSGQTVLFSISPATGPATIVPINGGVTDSSGKAYAIVTGTTTATTQNIFIYATNSGAVSSAPLAVVPSAIIPPSSLPKNITFTYGKTSLQSSENTLLTATVTDANNVPVSNQTVSFSLLPAGVHANITPINSGTTDSSGKAYAVISATIVTAPETIIVYAATGVSPNTVTSSSSISVSPAGVATSVASNIAMVMDKQSLTPDPSSPNNSALITATVTDANNSPVKGIGVKFSRISGPITVLAPASVTTGTDGKALVVLQATATTNPAYGLIMATTDTGVSQTIPILVAPIGKPQLSLSISKPIIEATDTEVLATVQVLDSTGAPVSGQLVNLTNVSGPFTLSATTVTTGVDGKGIVKLIPTPTPFASNILLSMSLDYPSPGTTYSLVTTAVVNPAIKLTVALDSTAINTSGQIIATATATTASGVPIPNQAITFTVPAPGHLVGASATTAADGTANAVIDHDSSATIGNIIVEVSVTSGGTVYRAYATAVPKAANIKLDLFVQSGFTPTYSIGGPLGSLTDYTTTTVDGLTSGLPIKAKVAYLDGTPLPNQIVTFTALDPGLFWNAAGGGVNGGSVTATTTTSGEAYVVAVPGNFPTAGFVHIQASTVINKITYTQIMPIAVQKTQVQKTFTLDKAALIISPNTSAIVNGSFSLKDSSGVVLVGQSVTFSIINGPAIITSSPTVTTDGTGNATVTVQAGPNITTRQTVNVNAAVVINGVTFNTVASFTVDPSVKLSLTTDLLKVDGNGGQVVATATLTDSAGAAISGQNVTFSILAGPAAISTLVSVTTSTSGTAMANIQTSVTNSTQNVLVQATTTLSGATYTQVTSFQVTKGVGTLVMTAPPTTSSTVKAPFPASVQWLTSISVKLLDANGNPRTNVPITLSALASDRTGYQVATDNSGTYAPTFTVNTDSQGVATFTTVSSTLTVGGVGGFDTSQVVWQATTNDASPVIGFASSTYNLTGA